MNSILKNPYRITGLLVGANAREQERQIRRLKQYIDANQVPEDNFTFEVIGPIRRTINDVNEATSKLNLDNDKLFAALFWFYNGNSITDDPAFNELKSGKIGEAVKIWGRLVTGKNISERNASAFFNWGTLYLNSAFSNPTLFEDHLQKGLKLKLDFLDSEFVQLLKSKATDTTFSISKIELQFLFLNEVHKEIERTEILPTVEFINLLSRIEFSAKSEFLKGFVQKPIENIENQISIAKTKRRANKANAADAGKTLFTSVKSTLLLIKNILGTSDLKYSNISDKVSDEILQCGIEHFSHYKDSSTDPGAVSMDLFRKAKSYAVGGVAIQRCNENTGNLQEWIDKKPERERQERVLEDFKQLTSLINTYENKVQSIANGKLLLSSARLLLMNIKRILGSNDEVYLGISTRVASDAQSMVVSEINTLQDQFANTYDNERKRTIIINLKEKLEAAWLLIIEIGAMDLRADFRRQYNTNKNTLSGLRSQLSSINTTQSSSHRPSSSSTSTTQSSSSGCYIATMAYGDYDHPQVLELRKFRDEVLDKTIGGKFFIKSYYFISPKLVSLLKNKSSFNSLIRKILNQIIKLIN